MSGTRDLEKIKGYVNAQTVLKGTASEHRGIVLTTAEGNRLRLQRLGGNPFSDPVTEALAGQAVSLEGFRLGSVFRFTKICEAEPYDSPPAGSATQKKRGIVSG